MIDGDGQIVTSVEGIGRCLNEHWQNVFSKRTTDEALRKDWLQNVKDTLKVAREKLRPSRNDVEKAIREATDSACGPDGIPFCVFKRNESLAAELLHEVADAMLDGTSHPDDDFNLAYMICFPKEAEGAMNDGTPFFNPGGTRPISIVDASNRLLASFFRITLEKCVAGRIADAQRGFI
jgi:hypothetical protein